MSIFDKLQYDKPIILDTLFLEGNKLVISLKKSYFKQKNKDQYSIQIHGHINGNYQCLAYMYFYLTPDLELDKTVSNFIGGKVIPECRGKGLYSLLLSKWIILCLESDVDDLDTNKNQRKAILLYTLTKFAFDLVDPNLYEKMKKYLIYICADNNGEKCLWIPNDEYSISYSSGNIAKDGQYKIISNNNATIIGSDGKPINSPYELLDTTGITIETDDDSFIPIQPVLTSQYYELKDPYEAYGRSKKIDARFHNK